MQLNLRVVSRVAQSVDRDMDLTLGEDGITFGRNPSNDLLLEDPERVVSSHHGRIDLRDGGIWLTDTSRNGTYLNFAQDPIPPHQPVAIHDGDLFTVGPYDIRVGFSSVAQAPVALGQAAIFGGGDLPEIITPNASQDILDLIGPETEGPGAFGEGLGLEDGLFADASALDERLSGPAPEISAATSPPPHTPVEHVFYKPLEQQAPEPPPAGDPQSFPENYDLLSDSWDVREQPADEPPVDVAPPAGDAFVTTAPLPDMSLQLEKEPPSPEPSMEEPSTPDPQVQDPEPEALAPAASSADDVPEASRPVRPTPPRRPDPARSRAANRASSGGELDAFLAGLGTGSSAEVADAHEFLERAGALLRELSVGLTRAMMARAQFKSELRLGVTTIRASENNPFKFSSDAEDILGRLLFRPSSGFTSAVPAAREAFEDIQAHEMAMTAGLQAALHALLARFDPAELERGLDGRSGLDQMLRKGFKARCWERFSELHAQATADADEDVMKLFGDIFAQAYQEQVQRLREARSSSRS